MGFMSYMGIRQCIGAVSGGLSVYRLQGSEKGMAKRVAPYL